MKTEKKLVCISCPMGCAMTAVLDGGRVVSVSGNSCKLGIAYAEKECVSPTRIMTSTVPITGGSVAVLPVKTARDIPKHKIFECVRALRGVTVHAPMRTGDVILADVAGTGVDVVATRSVATATCN